MDQEKVSEVKDKDSALPEVQRPENSTILPGEINRKKLENPGTEEKAKVKGEEKVDAEERGKNSESAAQKNGDEKDNKQENTERDHKENDKHNEENSQGTELSPEVPAKAEDKDKENFGAESSKNELVQSDGVSDDKLVEQDLKQSGKNPFLNDQQEGEDLKKDGENPALNEQQKVGDLEEGGKHPVLNEQQKVGDLEEDGEHPVLNEQQKVGDLEEGGEHPVRNEQQKVRDLEEGGKHPVLNEQQKVGDLEEDGEHPVLNEQQKVGDLEEGGKHPVRNDQQEVEDLKENGELKVTGKTKAEKEDETKLLPASSTAPEVNITNLTGKESMTDGKSDRITDLAIEPQLGMPDYNEKRLEETAFGNEKVNDSAQETEKHPDKEQVTKESIDEIKELKKEKAKKGQDPLKVDDSSASSKLDDDKLLANGMAVAAEDCQFIEVLDPGTTEDNCKRLKEQLYRYTAGGTLQHGTRSQLQRLLRRHAFQAINISVFGFPNSGKSAFINTVNFALSSSYEEMCGERKVYASDLVSLTNKRQFVSITEEIGLIDNKGIEEFSSQVLHEIGRQCEGYRGKDDFIPDDWNHGVKTTAKDILKFCCLGKLSRINDYIHCPIIVFNLDGPNDPEALLPLIQVCQKCCGTSPVVVMTHYDKVKDDKEILQRRKRQFQNLHCARMFCIENYTHANHERRVETEQTAFEILSACCLVADHFLVEAILRSKSTKCC